ncbi:MAG: hypothetical protein U0W24_16315 [Bacteroidales bacterium]
MKTKIYYNDLKLNNLILLILILAAFACNQVPDSVEKLNIIPKIFPDYTNVTIPANIAPLNFTMDSCDFIKAVFTGKGNEFEVDGKNNIVIPDSKWANLLKNSKEDSLQVIITVKKNGKWIQYLPFSIYVSIDEMDDYLVYRRIAPGYQKWSKMGLYQRNLTNFDESAIVNSDMLPGTCMNCHSFANNDPNTMQMHFRMENSGTILIREGKIEKLNTKTDQTISNCVYPYWHPSGKFISYSVDKTAQMFHSQSDKRIDVFDSESDIVVYDIDQNELFTNPAIATKENFEVAQSFSADGKKLFFCSAKARKMPDEFDQVKYSLCMIDFDADSAKISGSVDTLISAYTTGKSVSFPRMSPNGKFLLFSMADYGYFQIWHKESDLYLMNISDRKYFPLTGLNSPEADSYHSWSSNSKWIVTASRRIDGLYSHPFISHVDESGKTTKAFVIPQKSPTFYYDFMYSFNVPEFVKGSVTTDKYEVEKVLKSKGKQVNFRN